MDWNIGYRICITALLITVLVSSSGEKTTRKKYVQRGSKCVGVTDRKVFCLIYLLNIFNEYWYIGSSSFVATDFNLPSSSVIIYSISPEDVSSHIISTYSSYHQYSFHLIQLLYSHQHNLDTRDTPRANAIKSRYIPVDI